MYDLLAFVTLPLAMKRQKISCWSAAVEVLLQNIIYFVKVYIVHVRYGLSP